jgi:hypothetical protein
VSSLPSVPYLPSIALPGNQSGAGGPYGQGSRGAALGTNPGPTMPTAGPSIPQPRSGALVYVLIGVLVAAIGVLGFLLFRG